MPTKFASLENTMESMKTEDEMPEAKYRQGYSDGWHAAIEAMYGLMFHNRLSREMAHTHCLNHWRTSLQIWRRNDCSKVIWPPFLTTE